MQFTHPKLREAEFFIELLEATQERIESLTRDCSLEEEASFLFAGAINAFYSALEQYRKHFEKDAYCAFIKKHPEIYSHSHKGGWRSTTVHVRHVPITFAGYIRPDSVEVPMEFVRPSRLASKELLNDEVDPSRAPHYYLDFRGRRYAVAKFARTHLGELRAFMKGANQNRSPSA
jgi:hypothetical protein